MTFRRKVFVSEKISFDLKGRSIPVQALVSSQGAKSVFEESEIAPELREALGSHLEVTYKGYRTRCRVLREENSSGAVYSFRFEDPSLPLLKQIEMDIQEHGLPSPWRRTLPRLNPELNRHLPAPALVIFEHELHTQYFTVKNFTLGGLLLEFLGARLAGIKVGEELSMDIVTNGGDKIYGVKAIVRHISEEQLENTKVTLYGVMFSEGHTGTYRNLVRDHCLGLKSF